MGGTFHEIRDPIHVFVRVDDEDKYVIDSRPIQRLRHIHQLALSYLVYPGATHKRFEHSLGVMELAGRTFDVLTHPDHVHDEIRKLCPEIVKDDKKSYWRRVLRMAALCHDIGHLPFSHAAEHQLLPKGWTHETLTMELIKSDEMRSIWSKMKPSPDPTDIIKLSVGPQKAKDLEFSPWEIVLSEIIVGDSFGVDRMDYLLRDSHHAGVAYGKFDHYRLIDTLRILSWQKDPGADPTATLGVEEGGWLAAEGLLLARYSMFSQVYFHHTRRIFDRHLQRFLSKWLPGGKYPIDLDKHLTMTDNDVNVALSSCARDKEHAAHKEADCIVNRNQFRVIYSKNPDDTEKNPLAGQLVYAEAVKQFGEENVILDQAEKSGGETLFPVQGRDGRITPSSSLSQILRQLPAATSENVYVALERRKEAEKWISSEREHILTEGKLEND